MALEDADQDPGEFLGRHLGGSLFEIATDPPGFTFDEPRERLSEELKLPPGLEPQPAQIAETLPQIRLPEQIAL
jgi:glyoxalase family protein